jgi:hypothetical protein
MPTVSTFYGITIRINVPDHNPPHFHAYYGEQIAVINIRTGMLMVGTLPNRCLKLIEEWRSLHQEELIAAFEKAQVLELPGRINPLD